MVAKEVWNSEIEGDRKLVSIAMGDADQLPETGNILAGYGALVTPEMPAEMNWENRGRFPQWTLLREFTHSNPAQVVWELELQPLVPDSKIGWTIFGAERVDPVKLMQNAAR
jgi:hypothetical protein